MERVDKKRQVQADQAIFLLLLIWCILPAAMSIFNMAAGGLGILFPGRTAEEAALGYELGRNYLLPLVVYHNTFVVLGIVTMLFALLCIDRSWRNLVKETEMRKRLWYILLGVLLAWALVCSIVSDSFLRAIMGGNILFDGYLSYLIYASVFICASSLNKEHYRKILVRCFCIVMIWLSLIILAQEAGSVFLRACMPSKYAVVFNQFNHFGYMLCMSIIAMVGLFLYDTEASHLIKVLYILGEALLVYALLLNDTFGSYLAALAAVPVVYLFYIKNGRKISLAVLLPAVVFLIISLLNILGIGKTGMGLASNITQLGTDIGNIASNSEAAAMAGTMRFVKWLDTLKRISQRPIFGFGPDGFYGLNSITEGDVPHNEYLQVAGYLGIPGLVMYLSALVSLTINRWKYIKTLDPFVLVSSGIVVVYLFSACFGNPVYNTAPYYWLFLGILSSASNGEKALIRSDVMEEVMGDREDVKKHKAVRIVSLGMVCVILIGILIGFTVYTAVSDEHIREYADLQAMYNAELTAMAMHEYGKLAEDGDYWYDANTYSLISVNQPKPSPYGLGHAYCGDTYYSFANKYGKIYSYDESTDYRNMIIHLTAKTDENGDLFTQIDWVPAS